MKRAVEAFLRLETPQGADLDELRAALADAAPKKAFAAFTGQLMVPVLRARPRAPAAADSLLQDALFSAPHLPAYASCSPLPGATQLGEAQAPQGGYARHAFVALAAALAADPAAAAPAAPAMLRCFLATARSLPPPAKRTLEPLPAAFRVWFELQRLLSDAGELPASLELLEVLYAERVYRPTADPEGQQLAALEALAEWVLAREEPHPAAAGLLALLLRVNHAVLSPPSRLTQLLALAARTAPLDGGDLAATTLRTFARLRQLSAWFAAAPAGLAAHIRPAIEAAAGTCPAGQVAALWTQLQAHADPALFAAFAAGLAVNEQTAPGLLKLPDDGTPAAHDVRVQAALWAGQPVPAPADPLAAPALAAHALALDADTPGARALVLASGDDAVLAEAAPLIDGPELAAWVVRRLPERLLTQQETYELRGLREALVPAVLAAPPTPELLAAVALLPAGYVPATAEWTEALLRLDRKWPAPVRACLARSGDGRVVAGRLAALARRGAEGLPPVARRVAEALVAAAIREPSEEAVAAVAAAAAVVDFDADVAAAWLEGALAQLPAPAGSGVPEKGAGGVAAAKLRLPRWTRRAALRRWWGTPRFARAAVELAGRTGEPLSAAAAGDLPALMAADAGVLAAVCQWTRSPAALRAPALALCWVRLEADDAPLALETALRWLLARDAPEDVAALVDYCRARAASPASAHVLRIAALACVTRPQARAFAAQLRPALRAVLPLHPRRAVPLATVLLGRADLFAPTAAELQECVGLVFALSGFPQTGPAGGAVAAAEGARQARRAAASIAGVAPLRDFADDDLFAAVAALLLQVAAQHPRKMVASVAVVGLVLRVLLATLVCRSQVRSEPAAAAAAGSMGGGGWRTPEDRERERAEAAAAAERLRRLDGCAKLLGRVFEALKPCEAQLRAAAAHVVADYVSVHQHGLLPVSTRAALRPAVFVLLSMCSRHEIAHLMAVLDAPGKTLLKSLQKEYDSQHKFSGSA